MDVQRRRRELLRDLKNSDSPGRDGDAIAAIEDVDRAVDVGSNKVDVAR